MEVRRGNGIGELYWVRLERLWARWKRGALEKGVAPSQSVPIGILCALQPCGTACGILKGGFTRHAYPHPVRQRQWDWRP